uniref:Uncharacterized protein n=1 Tax=Hyaloperonospora arabidopsidis (strain Emoy2) TaxID=559515 RepID=M4BWQ8_HYAAE
MIDLELLRRVCFFCALWTLQCCASVLGAISRDAIFLRPNPIVPYRALIGSCDLGPDLFVA